MRDLQLIFGHWVQFFSAFLNSKSDKFDSDIVGGIHWRPVILSQGAEPTEEANSKRKCYPFRWISHGTIKLRLRYDPTCPECSTE